MKITPFKVQVAWGIAIALCAVEAMFLIPPIVGASAQVAPTDDMAIEGDVASVAEDVQPAPAGSVATPADTAKTVALGSLGVDLPIDPGAIPLKPWTLFLVILGVSAALMELLKGAWKWFNDLPALAKAGASTLIGTILGGVAAAMPLPWAWWISVVCGFLGGGGFTLIRTIGLAGQAKQTGGGGGGSVARLILVAALGGMATTQAACASLTPQQQATVDASFECGQRLYEEGKTCYQPCKEAADVAACVNPCGNHLLHTSFPACVAAYGVLAGPTWEKRINNLTALLIDVLDIVVPIPAPAPTSTPGPGSSP